MALHSKKKSYPIVCYDVYFSSKGIINNLPEMWLKDGLGEILTSQWKQKILASPIG